MKHMNAPKRIAFDARFINDRYHGIGRFAFRLLEAIVRMAAESTPKSHMIIFTGKDADSRFDWESLLTVKGMTQPNVEIQLGPWPLYWPHEQILWPKLLRRSKVDLFYSPYFTAPILTNIPKIITIHDLIFLRYKNYYPFHRNITIVSNRDGRYK